MIERLLRRWFEIPVPAGSYGVEISSIKDGGTIGPNNPTDASTPAHNASATFPYGAAGFAVGGIGKQEVVNFIVGAVASCDNEPRFKSRGFMSVRLLCRFLSFCLVSFLLSAAFAQPVTQSASRPPFGISAPVVFELNQGQAAATYRFVARNTGGKVRFTDSGPDFLISGRTERAVIRLRSVGVAGETRAKGKLPLRAKTNYLVGRDTSQWIRNVSTFGEVAYDGIYPGVNLLFYGSKDHLEHDLVGSPPSYPSVIRFVLAVA